MLPFNSISIRIWLSLFPKWIENWMFVTTKKQKQNENQIHSKLYCLWMGITETISYKPITFFLMAVANLVGRFIRTRQKKKKYRKKKVLTFRLIFFFATKCIGYGQFDFYKFLFFHSNNQSTNSKLGCIRWKIKFLLL